MLRSATTALVAAFLLLAPTASRAALSTYSQNFEALVQADPAALSNDGWLVFGNVWDPTHTTYLYGYGVFPAPNPGGGFSAIAAGEGGAGQGTQQLNIYSDYNNGDHAVGNQIEANVFREQIVGAADVGTQWKFTYDAKRGNLESPTTAVAFIKTLDPNTFATITFLTNDMTNVPASWGTYSIVINITPALVGHILQMGFNTTCSNYKGSGVFYDNINFALDTPTPAVPTTWGSLKNRYH
jgi:hypothetical protein